MLITSDDSVVAVAAIPALMAEGHDSLKELALRMTEGECGALLVRQRDGELAIVTERDIVRSLALGDAGAAGWATDIMTRDVISVRPTASISDVASLMIEAGVRHVVVQDDENDRVGVASMRDLIEPLLSS
ncbi:MAG: CBS domain-containing protein [Actinomycetia bacterium]|nr:CBS domain-containing protein [Actinomycetes bacterium]